MKKTLFLALLLATALGSQAQSTRSENVIVVTLDGMRWQEIFGGADSLLTYEMCIRDRLNAFGQDGNKPVE